MIRVKRKANQLKAEFIKEVITSVTGIRDGFIRIFVSVPLVVLYLGTIAGIVLHNPVLIAIMAGLALLSILKNIGLEEIIAAGYTFICFAITVVSSIAAVVMWIGTGNPLNPGSVFCVLFTAFAWSLLLKPVGLVVTLLCSGLMLLMAVCLTAYEVFGWTSIEPESMVYWIPVGICTVTSALHIPSRL